MDHKIVNTIDCPNGQKLVRIKGDPKRIGKHWQFQPIFDLLDQEGYVPGTKDDMNSFVRECKGIAEDKRFILLGQPMEQGYRYYTRAYNNFREWSDTSHIDCKNGSISKSYYYLVKMKYATPVVE